MSPVRPFLALGFFCRRRGLAAPHSGTPGPGSRRRQAGSVYRSSLRRGERTEHGARLARLAQLGDGSSARRELERVCPGLVASRKASRPRPLPSPFLPFPPPPPAAAAASSSPQPPRGPSALLVPLRSGAPGSGLVTWPSRHPVALKKKAIVFRKQQIGFLKAISPPAPATPS